MLTFHGIFNPFRYNFLLNDSSVLSVKTNFTLCSTSLMSVRKLPQSWRDSWLTYNNYWSAYTTIVYFQKFHAKYCTNSFKFAWWNSHAQKPYLRTFKVWYVNKTIIEIFITIRTAFVSHFTKNVLNQTSGLNKKC